MEHNYSHSESSGDDEENNTPTNDLTKHKNVFGETSSEEGSVKHSSSSEDHEEDNKINHESTKEKTPQSLISDVESANESESSDNSSGDELQPTNEVQEKSQKDNLFGDADDISSDDEDDVNKDNEETVQTKEVLRTESGDDEDDDANFMQNEQKQQMDTRIEVEIPKITTDLGSAVHFVRFPNFISVEARPFDAAVYEDEIEEDELLDEEGRTRLKLKVENTIRWRKYIDENAIELIESNARIVKWSDGSMSMHLGSEIFDVHQMSIQGDHNHLFIRQGTGLQGQAVFKTKLTFRPNSTKSATHKKMTNRLAMRHNQNQQKVRVLPIAGQDPESRKADLMKVEEGLLKAHVRREALKRRIREKSHMRGLSSNYVEDDDNNGDSISAIKNEFKSGARHSRDAGYNIGYESDEDRQKLLHSKRFGSDDEYDDDILGTKRKRDEDGEVRRKTYVLSDEEDDDDFANDNSQTSDNEQQSSQSS